MIIDTNFESLNDIDPAIVRYYREDPRKRVIGYTDDDEPQQITEDYVVIVLEQPDIVTYADVARRRGERKDWETVIKPELIKAIEWETFLYDHDKYLVWLADHAMWAASEPGDIDDDSHTIWAESEPARPVIDMTNRREVYERNELGYDANLERPIGDPIMAYDDEQFMVTVYHELESLPDEQTKEYLNNQRKLQGVEFGGVMCSATAEDMWGLTSVLELVRKGGSTQFQFDNGSALLLTPDNIESFYATWAPFRMGFFNQPA